MNESTEPRHAAYPYNTEYGYEPGLTKREYFAAMATQGMLAGWDAAPAAEIARASVDMADELIAALNDRSE